MAVYIEKVYFELRYWFRPSLATLKVLVMLKLISGILMKLLEKKKISDGNPFGGIMEPYRFEPYASESDEDGVSEDEKRRSNVHYRLVGLVFFPFNWWFIRDFVLIDKSVILLEQKYPS